MTDPAPNRWTDLALRAERAAVAAGGELASHPHGFAATEQKTTVSDLVTEIDRRVEELIASLLLEGHPSDSMRGEEGGARAPRENSGGPGVTWIVDPIDGTVNFVHGHPACCVSIAAEVEGRVVAGVVHVPRYGETFVARLGGGAFCNGRRLEGPPDRPLERSVLATGFSYDPRRRARQGAVVAHVLPRVADVRRSGSAALDLCWVAAGRVDAFWERGLNEWDLAAGTLIVTEAGGLVGSLDGSAPARTDACVLAASAHTFDPLRTLLVEGGATRV